MTGVPPAAPESAGAEVDAQADLTPRLGANLRRVRTRQGLSLDRLAERSGVSRAMLSQIELGRSTPTVNVLARVVRALRVPYATLLDAAATRPPVVVRAPHTTPSLAEGALVRRELGATAPLVFEELRLGVGTVVELDGSTARSIAVWLGRVRAEVGDERTPLEPGDALVVDGSGGVRLVAVEPSVLYVVRLSTS